MTRRVTPRKPSKPPAASAPSPATSGALAAVLFVVVGLLIYSNSFDGTLQFDDVPHLVQSADLHDLGNVARWWNHDPRRPIGYLSLALNYHFGGLAVRGYHAVNLAIHLLDALLVYWLLQLTLVTPALAGSAASRHRSTVALLGGLLFLVHPIQTQAVDYIVQRLASLATLFYLLSLALYVKGRIGAGGGALRPLWFVGSALAGLCGMFTKETVFTLPIAIALYEFSFLSSAARAAPRGRWVWLAVLGGLGLLIVPALLSFDLSRVFKTVPPQHGELFTLTPSSYALTQLRVIVMYMQLLVLPINQNLDHDVPVFDSPWDWRTLGALLLIAAVLFVAVKAFRRRRLLAFGILWFFLTLLVESSIIPINDAMFEHRLYLPMFGFCLVVVELAMSLGLARAVGALSALALVLGIATYRRNEVWRDPVTLWSDAAAKSPNKARPQTNAGARYLDRNQIALAEPHLKRAVEINPDYAVAQLNLGAYYQRVGNPALAEQHFRRAAELTPDQPGPYLSLGLMYLQAGRAADAEAPLLQALARDSTAARVYGSLGLSWFMRGDDDRAVHFSEKALELDPRQYEALNNLGRTWRRKGDPAKARQYYQRALEVEPQSTEVLVNMGNLAMAEGSPENAESLYRRALSINPGYADALNGLGVMYYGRRDYATAKSYFEDAVRRNPDHADAQNNLGLCYQQEGRPDLALEHFQRALQLRPTFRDAQWNLESATRAGARR